MVNCSPHAATHLRLISGDGVYRTFITMDAACRSPTICNMLKGGYRESVESCITFPEFDAVVLEEVVRYLRSPGSKAGALFEPRADVALRTLMAADFLELCELVNACAQTVANNFDALDRFGPVPDRLLSKILRRLCPEDLLRAELLLGKERRIPAASKRALLVVAWRQLASTELQQGGPRRPISAKELEALRGPAHGDASSLLRRLCIERRVEDLVSCHVPGPSAAYYRNHDPTIHGIRSSANSESTSSLSRLLRRLGTEVQKFVLRNAQLGKHPALLSMLVATLQNASSLDLSCNHLNTAAAVAVARALRGSRESGANRNIEEKSTTAANGSTIRCVIALDLTATNITSEAVRALAAAAGNVVADGFGTPMASGTIGRSERLSATAPAAPAAVGAAGSVAVPIPRDAPHSTGQSLWRPPRSPRVARFTHVDAKSGVAICAPPAAGIHLSSPTYSLPSTAPSRRDQHGSGSGSNRGLRSPVRMAVDVSMACVRSDPSVATSSGTKGSTIHLERERQRMLRCQGPIPPPSPRISRVPPHSPVQRMEKRKGGVSRKEQSERRGVSHKSVSNGGDRLCSRSKKRSHSSKKKRGSPRNKVAIRCKAAPRTTETFVVHSALPPGGGLASGPRPPLHKSTHTVVNRSNTNLAVLVGPHTAANAGASKARRVDKRGRNHGVYQCEEGNGRRSTEADADGNVVELELSLRDNPIGDVAAIAFADSIVFNAYLCRNGMQRTLRSDGYTRDGINDVSCPLNGNIAAGCLQRLHLGGNPAIDHVGATCLADTLRRPWCSLRSLSLSGCSLGGLGVRSIASALIAHRGCEDGNAPGPFLPPSEGSLEGQVHAASPSSSKIEVLDLSRTITDHGHGCSEVHAAGRMIASVLATNTTLTELDLSGNQFPTSALTEIARGLCSNATLVKLRLASVNMLAEGALNLATALQSNTTLSTLDVSRNRLTPDATSHFAALLVQQHMQPLRARSFQARDNCALQPTQGCRGALANLDVSGNGMNAETAASFGAALESNPVLRSLSLGVDERLVDLRMRGEGCAVLVKGLARGAGVLEYLGLQGHCIRNTGSLALARALGSRGAAALRTVDLRGNQIGDRGALALLEAITKHYHSVDGEGSTCASKDSDSAESITAQRTSAEIDAITRNFIATNSIKLDMADNAISPGTEALLTELGGGHLRFGSV